MNRCPFSSVECPLGFVATTALAATLPARDEIPSESPAEYQTRRLIVELGARALERQRKLASLGFARYD
jgi:hypothetical protein